MASTKKSKSKKAETNEPDNMSYKAIVYTIYPNDKQNIQCQKTFGHCRFVYNKIMDVQQERYKNGEKHMSKEDANTYCNRVLKSEYPFLKEVDKFSLTNAIFNLENAYSRFFERLSKFPKHKTKRKSRKSYKTNMTNNNITIGSNYIKLPKLGKVKAVIHRLPDENWVIKSATVVQNKDGTFQVSIGFAYKTQNIDKASKDTDAVIGLDYKSDGLYMDSNGMVGTNHKYFRESHKKLARAQKKLSHMIQSHVIGYKTVGNKQYPEYDKSLDECKNIQKQRKIVAKIHKKIANQRNDNLHKISTAIAKQYDVVCVETLNMKAMSNKGFGNGKATMDNGYGMFLTMLEYKLADQGKYFVKVDKWYPSSQLCHCCGQLHPEMKKLNNRIMICDCGFSMDRDQNAALNILTEGLRILRTA